jgi:sterol desaturase/sphingolipid hydroxylase (fatty acid hydroxylase superfamily)
MVGRRGSLATGSAVGVGVGAWTLAEYVAHRWVMHGRRGPTALSREHRAHHADPEATDPWMRALGYAAIVTPVAVLSAAAGCWPAGAGWALGYAGYEQFHWREHHCPPLGRWERAARRRHFAHHCMSARANFGVTTSLWDRVFGTSARDKPVRVPARLAMPWLLDATGAVGERYRNDYVLVQS